MIEIAIVGGTGLNTFDGAQALDNDKVSSDTPYGVISAPLQIFSLGARRFGFMARHGQPHRIPPHRINYRANLWALRERGVRGIIAVNAVGGISHTLPTGAIVIPDQIIDYTYGREHTYYDGGSDVLEHIDFSRPYCAAMRTVVLRAASAAGVPVIDGGVYGATQGPRLESAAEIERMQRDGCDVVGMTGMPEAALARELGLDYACLALSVNWGAGIMGNGDIHAEIHQSIEIGMGKIRAILARALPALRAKDEE